MPLDIFQKLYETRDTDYGIFAEAYEPPPVFEPYKEYKVAEYVGYRGAKGVVYESRAPARFYKVVAYNENGVSLWAMATGSGEDMGHLAKKMAIAASRGMLELDTQDYM